MTEFTQNSYKTAYQKRCELVGGVVSEFISHELFNDESIGDYQFNIDDYYADIKPYLIESLKMKWEDDITILTNSEGAGSETESH